MCTNKIIPYNKFIVKFWNICALELSELSFWRMDIWIVYEVPDNGYCRTVKQGLDSPDPTVPLRLALGSRPLEIQLTRLPASYVSRQNTWPFCFIGDSIRHLEHTIEWIIVLYCLIYYLFNQYVKLKVLLLANNLGFIHVCFKNYYYWRLFYDQFLYE